VPGSPATAVAICARPARAMMMVRENYYDVRSALSWTTVRSYQF
jgi:hypothetical protein